MGFVTMSIALGIVLGPMLGGMLYHTWGYLSVFLSGYIIVGADFVLRLAMLQTGEGEVKTVGEQVNGKRIYGTMPGEDGNNGSVRDVEVTDVRTPLLLRPSPTSTSGTSTAVSTETSSSSSSTMSDHYRSTAVVCKTSHRHPLLTLLSTPRMLAAILGDFMQSTILTGLESTLPLRIKTLFGFNSLQVCIPYLAKIYFLSEIVTYITISQSPHQSDLPTPLNHLTC